MQLRKTVQSFKYFVLRERFSRLQLKVRLFRQRERKFELKLEFPSLSCFFQIKKEEAIVTIEISGP